MKERVSKKHTETLWSFNDLISHKHKKELKKKDGNSYFHRYSSCYPLASSWRLSQIWLRGNYTFFISFDQLICSFLAKKKKNSYVVLFSHLYIFSKIKVWNNFFFVARLSFGYVWCWRCLGIFLGSSTPFMSSPNDHEPPSILSSCILISL